ncbi:MAG: hypothetical protein KDD06_08745 [Phaeodactylibacter sp.]|nr:hypothetical protein [Phaeodactylibacter sp.]MCB9266585.1 hypothetical protein [Lewinellaceae bacterium]MCB9288658.1 hypothetical protein [Lewinellaceae bacterium]
MFNEKRFKDLFERRGNHLVSVFIPTYRANHSQEDRLRLKNALLEASRQLEEHGFQKQEARAYLEKAFELLENQRFFTELSDGLCLFVGEDFFSWEVLPVNFNPYVFVGNRFYLRPVLPVLTGQSRFFLLALSQNEVRFFEGHQHSITPVRIDDLVPGSMEEMFEMSDVKEHLQHHSGQGARRGKQGSREAVYHGQASGKDDHKDDIKKYFKEIDRGLMEMLYDETPPMVIAAVDYLVPLYREVNRYPHLLDENVSGNPEGEGPVALHERAWAIIGRYYREKQEEKKTSFREAMAQDKASAGLTEIIPAAINGRVEALYVNKDYHTYGLFDEEKNSITIHEKRRPNSQELLGMAAVMAYLQGGAVQILEREDMPVPASNINAVFRY